MNSTGYETVATNRGEEDEECPCCIITLAVVSTLMGILLLSDVSLFIDNCKGVNQENVMRRPYFSPFALPSIIYSVYHQCKKTDMTDIWFIITTLLTDIIVTSVVFVYCTSEVPEEDCNLSVRIVIPILCMIQLIGRLSNFVFYRHQKVRVLLMMKTREEMRAVTDYNPGIHSLITREKTSHEGRRFKNGRCQWSHSYQCCLVETTKDLVLTTLPSSMSDNTSGKQNGPLKS